MSHATATMMHDAIARTRHPESSFNILLPNGYRIKYFRTSRSLSIWTVIPGSKERKMMDIVRISGRDNTVIVDSHGYTHVKIYKAWNSVLSAYGLPVFDGRAWSDNYNVLGLRAFRMSDNPLPARLQEALSNAALNALPEPEKPLKHKRPAREYKHFRLIKRKPATPQT